MTGPYFSDEEWKEKLKNTTIGKGYVMTFRDKWEKLIDALFYGFITGISIPTEENKMNNAKATTNSDISEREMYERDQRLSCLAHAVDVARSTQDHDKIIERAKSYYDFIEKGK